MPWNSMGDLGINLLAALIGFGVARLVQWIRFARRSKNARRFWRTFMRGDASIVLSGHDEQFLSYERSGLIGAGCVRALLKLQEKFSAIRENPLPIHYSSRVRVDDLRGAVVMIGGPDANAWVERVLGLVGESLGVEVVAGTVSMRDKKTGRIYSPTDSRREMRSLVGHSGSSWTGSDCGLIARISNPFDTAQPILILAGSFGEGTEAAANLVCSGDVEDNDIVRSGANFEAIFTVDVVDGIPGRPRIEVLRGLSSDGRPEGKKDRA